MRVALLTDADVFAGTERHILDLAVALNQLPNAPIVSIVCPLPSPLATRAREAGIATIAVPTSASGVLGGVFSLPTVRILRRLLQSGRVEILHAHNGRMALHAALATVLARKGKVVVTQHFLSPSHAGQSGIKGKIFHAAHRFVNARVAHFIAISRAVETQMQNRGQALEGNISVILNALPDPDESLLRPPAEVKKEFAALWSTPSRDNPLIICAARLETEKSVETLIAAIKILRDENIGARCLIAGEGDEKENLQNQIERENLGDCVRLLGFRNDVLSLMRAGDIFVLPSLAEPFGLVILEAMALSRPVIATNAGGPPEIIEGTPGVLQSGILIPPANANALANALRELIKNPARRNAMGRAGRARFQTHFQPERMAQSVRDVYARALRPSE